MSEDQCGPASEREDIAAHVANFKATQEKFQREREEYFAATLVRREENALPFESPTLGLPGEHSGPK